MLLRVTSTANVARTATLLHPDGMRRSEEARKEYGASYGDKGFKDAEPLREEYTRQFQTSLMEALIKVEGQVAEKLGEDVADVRLFRVAAGQHSRADVAVTTEAGARDLFEAIRSHRADLSTLQHKNGAVLVTLKSTAQDEAKYYFKKKTSNNQAYPDDDDFLDEELAKEIADCPVAWEEGVFLFYKLDSTAKTCADICSVDGIMAALDSGELQLVFGKVSLLLQPNDKLTLNTTTLRHEEVTSLIDRNTSSESTTLLRDLYVGTCGGSYGTGRTALHELLALMAGAARHCVEVADEPNNLNYLTAVTRGSRSHKQQLDRRVMCAGHHVAQHCRWEAGATAAGIVVVVPQESNVMVGNMSVFIKDGNTIKTGSIRVVSAMPGNGSPNHPVDVLEFMMVVDRLKTEGHQPVALRDPDVGVDAIMFACGPDYATYALAACTKWGANNNQHTTRGTFSITYNRQLACQSIVNAMLPDLSDTHDPITAAAILSRLSSSRDAVQEDPRWRLGALPGIVATKDLPKSPGVVKARRAYTEFDLEFLETTSGLQEGEVLPPKRARRSPSSEQPSSSSAFKWYPASELEGKDKAALQDLLKRLEDEGLPADATQWKMRKYVGRGRFWHCTLFGSSAPTGSSPGECVRIMKELHPDV